MLSAPAPSESVPTAPAPSESVPTAPAPAPSESVPTAPKYRIGQMQILNLTAQ